MQHLERQKQHRNLPVFAEFCKPTTGAILELIFNICPTDFPLAYFSFVLGFHREFEMPNLINYSSLSSSMDISTGNLGSLCQAEVPSSYWQ